MKFLPPPLLQDGWPIFVGVLLMGVSCALLQAPPDLSASKDVDGIYDVGSFDEPTGTITEGGTLAGEWQGFCEIYGYPYGIELDLVDDAGGVTGTGTWDMGWSEFTGTIEGERTADGVQMEMDVDYYGYPLFMVMEATFTDGVTLEGSCEYSYGSRGTLFLERV